MINRFALTALVLATLLSSEPSSTAAAQRSEKDAALATVQMLLDGWRESDAAKLETALHPDFREVTLHLQDGKWNFNAVTRETLVKTMARVPKGSWDDRLIDPQVHVSGPIAVVWSPYKFTVRFVENGVAQAPVHCGIETFQLYLIDGAWKIVSFADTHSDTCS